MKIYLKIILILLFFANIMFSQQGISLLNSKNGNVEYIKEHHRIKIKTTNGKNISGQFTILDSTNIIIKNKVINLEQIVKIRKASGFSTFMETISITAGAAIIGAITYSIISDKVGSGYGVVAGLPTGLPALILPLTSHNNHISKKWEYKIITKNEPIN